MIRILLLALALLAFPLPGKAQPFMPGTPRQGVDYEVLATPQATFGKGKIEVAEVFSYGCIHCFHFQPAVSAWKKTLLADVRWEYVPAAFGGPLDNFARGFFAAQTLGVLEKTHDAVFDAVFVTRQVKSGSPEEIADVYARLGVDRAKFLAAMHSAESTAKLAQAREFAVRTGIQGTPTIVVNGRYRVMGNTADGLDGVFKTVDFLLAKERSRAASAKATAAAVESKP